MKKILVPCDFSVPALNAYRQALDIATQSKGVIHLLHIIEPPLLNDSALMPALNFEEQVMKERAELQFNHLVNRDDLKKVKTSFEIKYGAVSSCILEYINENDIDLVLMGSHGARGIKEYFIGSNAEKIVRQSPVPVLIIKNYYGRPIRNIAFPHEVNIDSQGLLIQKVKTLQNFFKAKLHLVWINTPQNFIVDNVIRKKLEDFANQSTFSNYTINIYNHVSPEGGIHGFAEMINADLIAIGTHSHTGLSHLLNGSIAEDLVNHSARPIWTYTMKKEGVVN